MQVFHQRRDSLVEFRQLAGESLEVRSMPVPTAKRQRDAADSHFHQTAGHQELVHPVRPRVFAERRVSAAAAIAISERRIFLVQVQRFHEFARRQHVEGLSRQRIGTAVCLQRIDLPSVLIEARQERLTVAAVDRA